MSAFPIAVVPYVSSPESVRSALELCDGFSSLNHSDRVLLKPNLVAWDDSIPAAPFGVFTTTRIVEDVIVLLKELGCHNITIGEGSVVFRKGMGTEENFAMLGYNELRERYGVKLVDFNKSMTVEHVIHDDLKLQVASEAIENDFLINLPALKTHADSKVSLGIKNLKGCLKIASKKMCHHEKYNLDYCFSFLADIIKPSLTIVDGIYALEKGPLFSGTAHRKNLLIASKDFFGADLAAAYLIGYDPHAIEHFGYVAERNGLSLDLKDYQIVGEELNNHTRYLEWDWQWNEDNTGPAAFSKVGLTGPSVPKYDQTLCSGCSPIVNMTSLLVLSAFEGKPLPPVEILNGKVMQAKGSYEQTLLLGSCIIKANKNNPCIKHAIPVPGCPPQEEDLIAALREVGLNVNLDVYRQFFAKKKLKYDSNPDFDYSLYTIKE